MSAISMCTNSLPRQGRSSIAPDRAGPHANLAPQSRQLLEQSRQSLAETVVAAETPCDRRAVFESSSAQIPCSQVHVVCGCGPFEYLAPGSPLDVDDRGSLFAPLRFEFEEAAWPGPLFVVMDGRTASASEHFLALLEANSAATFLGQRSYGAGCGYIGGGVPAQLTHLELTRLLPAPRPNDPATERSQIAQQSAAFSRAFVSGDTTALGNIYLEDARILPPGEELRGRTPIRRYFAPRPQRRLLAHAMESASLRIDGARAIDRGRWRSVNERAGAEPDSAGGPDTVIWRRETDGIWRIEMDIWLH